MAKKKPAKKAKKAATRSSYIAKAPIRRLMKDEGASLVAEDALEFLIDLLTKAAQTKTKEAIKLVKADKRKRVTAADISAA
ncbi:MAG: histone-like protein [Promethearchaeota archaeon]